MRKTNRTTHRMRKLVSVLAIFTLLFGLTGCSKKDPREVLEEAYEKTFTKGNPTEALLGLAEINSKLKDNQAQSAGFSFTLQELTNEDLRESAGILSGLGITVDTASDLLNRKSAATMDITYGGTTYLTLGSQLQGSKIHITSPQLLDGSLSVDLSTLDKDLASDSMLGQLFTMYGITLPDNFSADLLTALLSPDSLANLGNLASAWEHLDDAVDIKEAEKASVSLPSDVSVKKVYNVTIPKDAYVNFVGALIKSGVDYYKSLPDSFGQSDAAALDTSELEASLKQAADAVGDIVLTVAVAKDGYIRYAAGEIEDEENRISLTAMFTGDKHPLTETEIKLAFTTDGKESEVTYEEAFDTKDNKITFSLEATSDNKTILNFAGEGEFTDVEQGKKYTLDFNYLELELADSLSVSLSGSTYVDTTKCDISAPSGTEYSLFTMSEQEFEELLATVVTNLQEDPLFSNLLELIGTGY